MNREKIKHAIVEWLFDGDPPEDRKREVVISLSVFAVFLTVLGIALLRTI